jgi:antitoxin component YwqK of YwqJK toxin-antitoxin module
LIQQGNYQQGLESGNWKFFRNDGSLEYEGTFHNGEKTGKWYKYSKNGKKKLWEEYDEK